MKNKLIITMTVLLLCLLSKAQNPYLVKSKAILIGYIDDTSFTAKSTHVICLMDYVSGKVSITFSANSFKTNIPEKDSLLSSLFQNEINIEFNAGDVFDIKKEVFNSTFKKTVGELNIGEESFEEPIEYRINNSSYNYSQGGTNSTNDKDLKLTLKCDFILDKYYKNAENIEIFSPILEIEVIQASINKNN